jgi:RES domain-containing protein
MALKRAPANLAERQLRFVGVPGTVFRISRVEYRNPFFWSRLGRSRFDLPEGRFGVLYTAEDLETCLLEVFGDRWLKTRLVSATELAKFEVLIFSVSREVRVADMTGRWLNRLGTDANLFASTDYALTQEWSRQLMAHPRARDGLCYHCRKNPKKFSYALYDTAEAKKGLRVRGREPLVGAADLPAILDKYEVALIS